MFFFLLIHSPKGFCSLAAAWPLCWSVFSLTLTPILAPDGIASLWKYLFSETHSPVCWIKQPLSSKAWASLNSPQLFETFQGFMHLGKCQTYSIPSSEWKKNIHIFRTCLLCYRQLLILFTSVIIINKKLLFLLECQMRHKKTTAVAIAQLNNGGREKGKKKNPN